MLQGRRLKDMGGEKMPPPIEMCNPKLKLTNRLNDWHGLKNMGLVTPLLKDHGPNVFARFHYVRLLIAIRTKQD